jgi:phosphatidate cytidylyltransferase
LSVLLLAALIFAHARFELESAEKFICTLLLGFLLIGLGGVSVLSLMLLDNGGPLVGGLIAVVCVCDISAYFVGRLVGGVKLAPAISPGKTISGALGGFTLGGAIGVCMLRLVHPAASLPTAVFVAGGVALSAQLGDLAKSVIKRLWGAKDSGALLPGHGGVLDRVDGILGGGIFLWGMLVLGAL